MMLVQQLAELEESNDLHLGRLLILMSSFSGASGEETIDGITKLAKLDFFLRYPAYLTKALKARGVAKIDVSIHSFEQQSVEGHMVRYKYGPWDFKYRRLVNLLIAKGLVSMVPEGRTIRIGLTEKGLEVAKELSTHEEFSDIVTRSQALKKHLDLSASNLVKFVYENFPEIGSLKLGEEIGH